MKNKLLISLFVFVYVFFSVFLNFKIIFADNPSQGSYDGETQGNRAGVIAPLPYPGIGFGGPNPYAALTLAQTVRIFNLGSIADITNLVQNAFTNALNAKKDEINITEKVSDANENAKTKIPTIKPFGGHLVFSFTCNCSGGQLMVIHDYRTNSLFYTVFQWGFSNLNTPQNAMSMFILGTYNLGMNIPDSGICWVGVPPFCKQVELPTLPGKSVSNNPPESSGGEAGDSTSDGSGSPVDPRML